MEEANDEPHYILLSNRYFTVYEYGRRILLSGQLPPELDGQRGIKARTWRAYHRRMAQMPPWERAERYQQMIAQLGFQSIRALARATGEDHSRMARILKVLELPESVLAVLRAHAGHANIRAHFTERRLRELVRQNQREVTILREINQVLQGPPLMKPGPHTYRYLPTYRRFSIPKATEVDKELQVIPMTRGALHR